MNLLLATLIPGLLLLALGAALVSGHSTVTAMLKAFPRSPAATYLFFGAGSIWFLTRVWDLSPADFGEYRTLLTVVFAVIALLSFKYVPDFLAVRGLAIILLVGAMPLLDAAYMEYEHPQRLFMVTLVYLGIALGIYLGAAPYRLRDFFGWLFQRPGRSRTLGAGLLGYGVLLTIVAFTY